MCIPIFSLLKIVSKKWRINTGISVSPKLSQQGNSRVCEARKFGLVFPTTLFQINKNKDYSDVA
jgi:hypothetical protein